jgi:PAS domain S-box-containing protein
MLVIAFMSIWGAAHDRGPFTGQGPLNNTLSLQLFLFFAAIPFMVFAVIVEEEKQTRQELASERAQLTEAQRLAQMGSWSWEPDTDRVTWSEELYRIAGRDPSLPPLKSNELGELYTAESWKRLQSAVEEALAAQAPYELDLEMVRQDGSTRWVRARREAQRASDGQLTQLHGTLQDITEQKLAETALRESEARFHDLFRNAGVGMIIVSPNGHFIAANEAFCGYLGYTEEELCQMTVQDVTQPEDWPQFSAKLREALETKVSFRRFEKRCRHKSGRTVYTEAAPR